MRRALQRCSASLRPSTALVGARKAVCGPLAHQNAVSRTNTTISIGARSFQHSAFARQQAAAARPADANSEGPVTRFADLETRGMVHPRVVRTLTQDMQLETLTEVQAATINAALDGTDIVAQAKTGTGKTMAFLLPVLQNIISKDPKLAEFSSRGGRGPRSTADDIRALIISPTRELAEQIAEEARKVTKGTGIIVQTAVGGTQKMMGLRAIQQRGCHILVGTPGRLNDILTDPNTRVEAPDLSALVFDEADRLLDQGFWPAIQDIMRSLPSPAEKERQTLMFSATIPQDVVDIVRQTLRKDFRFVKCVREDEVPTHERVKQKIVRLEGMENTFPALVELGSRLIEEGKQPGARPFKAIVYFNSTAETTYFHEALRALTNDSGADADADAFGSRGRRGFSNHPWPDCRIYEIHSKLTQAGRTMASESFRRCETGILLSSDVTARGMDFPNVTHVIQVGLATSKEQYIHRLGRTARAGKEGEGWVFANNLDATELRYRLKGIPLVKDESLTTASLDLSKAADVPAETGNILAMCQNASQKISMSTKSKTYLALLGVYQFISHKGSLIESINRLSQYGWGLAFPPKVSANVASRLRIDRVPGINIGHSDFGDEGRSGGQGFGGRRNDSFSGNSGGRGRPYSNDRNDSRRGGFGGADRYGGGGRGGDRRGGGGRNPFD